MDDFTKVLNLETTATQGVFMDIFKMSRQTIFQEVIQELTLFSITT